MKDGEKVIVDGKKYEYCAFYGRLENISDIAPAIICPKCFGKWFTISYGNYECIANCKCGNSFTIYDG